MDHYLRRSVVCEHLRLSLSTSYKLVGTGYGTRISENDVVELLNRSRNESQKVLKALPSDILTPAELAAIPDVAASDISERDILNWTKRKRNPAPCFRINKQTRRIQRSSFLNWLDETSKVRRFA